MNILAVCTFSDVLETGVFAGTNYGLRILRTPVKHSQNLASLIKSLATETGLSLSDLDLLCCSRGPGSFTGLRIGMATLKGLALGLGKPLVSVSTMEIMAQGLEFFKGAVVPILDARKKRYYAAVFENGVRKSSDLDLGPEDLASYLQPWENILLVGRDAPVFAQKIQGKLKAQVLPDIRSYCQNLAKLSAQRLEKEGPDDIGQGPSYVRKSDAEQELEEKAIKENQK